MKPSTSFGSFGSLSFRFSKMSTTYDISTTPRYVRKSSSFVAQRREKSQYVLIEALTQDLSWLRAFVPAYIFSADRASFRGFEGEPAIVGRSIAGRVGCSQSK